YVGTVGTLTFPPGTLSRSITLAVLGDRVAEGNETFTVNLTSTSGITVADPQVVVTLTNDDPPGLSIENVTVREGALGPVNARFLVRLAPAGASAVTVDYAT